MFEKDSEEYVNKDTWLFETARQDAKYHFQKGAVFGYNKANEWHYVKDGDLPKEDNRIMLCYCRKGYHGNIGIYVYRLFTKREFMENKVVAWKEIVLPELKESE